MNYECPKCRSKMEVGFIKDQGDGMISAATWVEGQLEKSLWAGTKLSSKQKQLTVKTYRCSSCGYLESYAR